jgi:hypothetical protein
MQLQDRWGGVSISVRRAESRVVILAFWISVLCDVAVMEGVRNLKKNFRSEK